MKQQRTNDEIQGLLNSNEPLELVRQRFSAWWSRLEQIQAQMNLTPMQMRDLEFQAAEDIIQAWLTAGGEPTR